jgi:hypothetical protein
MPIPTTIFTRPGYDDVTGVGSPNAITFIRAGAAARFSPGLPGREGGAGPARGPVR